MNGEAVLAGGRSTASRRGAFVRWVRRTHGWFGLWGAVLGLPAGATNTRVERSRPVPWAERGSDGRPLMQPERWQLTFGGPDRLIQAEYWVGNASVALRTTENGFIATLTNLHKGVGMPVAWILLIDTLAGSLIFLSVSGVVLWWETHRRRLVGMAIFGVSVALTVALATSQL